MAIANVADGWDLKRLLKQLVILLLMFGGKYIPPFGEMTSFGMGILFLLIGAIYGWVFLDFVFTNMCAILALGFSGAYSSLVQCFGACFGSDIAVMMLGCLILCAFIEVMDLTNVIISCLLNLKITKNNTTMFFLMFFVVDWVVSAISSCQLTTILFCDMYQKLCQEGHLEPKTKTNSFVICGIALVAVLGDIGLPFKATAVAIMGTYEVYVGAPFSFGNYLLYMTSYQLFLIVLFVLIGKYIIHVDFSAFRHLEIARVSPDKRQKMGLWCIGLMMAAFILSSTNLAIFSYLKLGGIALGTCVVMLIIQVDGEPLLDLGKISAKFNWGMYFFITFFMTFADFIGRNDVGITITLKTWLALILSALPPIAFLVLAMLLATVLTNFLNNLPIAVIFISIMYALGEALAGINLAAACLALVMASFAACATPAANPCVAIAFSYKELIDTKTSMLVGTGCCAVLCVVTMVVYYPFLCLVL